VHKQLVQSGVTDWDFIIGRIDAAGLICTIDNAKFTIKDPNLQADAKLRLTYGNDILELDTAMDSRIQTPEVSTSVWDYRTQQMIGEDSSSSTNELSDAVNDPYRIRSSVSLTQDELKAIAAAKKTRQLLSKLKGKVRYQGQRRFYPVISSRSMGLVPASPGKFLFRLSGMNIRWRLDYGGHPWME
jgi:phage protein D